MPPRSITRWRRTTPALARRWSSASVASFAAKLEFEASTAGTRPALAATPIDLPRPSGPRSNSWLPKVMASYPIRDMSRSSPPVSRVAAPNAVPML